MPLAASPDAINQLSEMVTQCHHALRVYGKSPEQVMGAVKLFAMVLGKYSLTQVQDAFRAYLEHHADMPTPADIVGYIRRSGRPPMDKAFYIALCQKKERTAWRHGSNPWEQGDGLSSEENAYIRDFERLEKMGGAT